LSTLTLDICVSKFLDSHSTVVIIIWRPIRIFFVYCIIFLLMVNMVHVVLLDVSPVRSEKTVENKPNLFQFPQDEKLIQK